MIKFIEFLILGYLIYIFLRNVFGRFFLTQGKQAAGSFRQNTGYNTNTYQRNNEPVGKNYGNTKVDHIPNEEIISRNISDNEGEYIDYKEVK